MQRLFQWMQAVKMKIKYLDQRDIELGCFSNFEIGCIKLFHFKDTHVRLVSNLHVNYLEFSTYGHLVFD